MPTTAECPSCNYDIELHDPEEGDLVMCPECDCYSSVSQVEPVVLLDFEDEDEDEDEEGDDLDFEDDDWPDDDEEDD